METSIRQILNIMEDIVPDVSVAMGMMPGDPPDRGIPVDSGETSISPEALDLAQQLIAMAGSPELARDIIDRVAEASEILGDVVDDTNMISRFADSTPEDIDLPNNISSFDNSLF